MILKILQTGNDTLRLKAKALTSEDIKKPSTQQLIDLMIDTLREQTGVGLAAPQVGEPLRIIIIEDLEKYHKKVSKELLQAQKRKPINLTVIINPVIEILEDDPNLFFEGCLSVEGYVAVTPRASKVAVTGLDREGNDVSFEAEGWHARILQHEVDHLNGALYVDTMLQKTFITTKHYGEKWLDAHPDQLTQYIETTRE